MPFICIAIDFIDLLSKSAAEDLALGGGTGSLCLVGIDVHGGSAVLVHTNHYIIEDQPPQATRIISPFLMPIFSASLSSTCR